MMHLYRLKACRSLWRTHVFASPSTNIHSYRAAKAPTGRDIPAQGKRSPPRASLALGGYVILKMAVGKP